LFIYFLNFNRQESLKSNTNIKEVFFISFRVKLCYTKGERKCKRYKDQCFLHCLWKRHK